MIDLPRPGRLLHPNSVKRARWFYGARAEQARVAKAAARLATMDAARRAGLSLPAAPAGRVLFSVEWRLGYRERAFDDDNAVAMLKASRDGIADALGFNDRLFRVGDVAFVRAKGRVGSVVVILDWD